MPVTIWSTNELVTALKMNTLGAYLLWDSADAGVVLPAASVTTPSLSQAHGSLLVVCSALESSAAAGSDILLVRANGDSAGNYGYTHIQVAATNVVSGASLYAATFIPVATITAGSSPVHSRGSALIWIPGYTSSVEYKKFISIGGTMVNANAANMQLDLYLGFYGTTLGPTTSLTFFCNSGGNFITGGRFSVYGLPA